MPRLFCLFLCCFALHATAAPLWQTVDEKAMQTARGLTNSDLAARRNIVPQFYRTLALDRAGMEAVLAAAPREFSGPMETESAEVELPLPEGGYGRFFVQESSIMEPALAAKFPQIKTFIGQGIDDPAASLRLDMTPRGLHAIILSARGAVFIDPYWRDSDGVYLAYRKSDYLADKPFRCLVDSAEKKKSVPLADAAAPARPSGAQLRVYKLALACTGEYSVAVASPNPPSVLTSLSAIITSVNRVNAVYERDFAIRMVLVANNDKVIYLDGATDPYTNSSGSTMLGQNQSTLDSVIGSANYNIGHVFSTGGGGVANLGVPCTSSKARGVTGSSNPTGDPYDIDYVAHEMGHQFGGNHTFNSTLGSCGGGNRNGSTAYETGSGTTIMAYAGICSTSNLAPNSDDYFHSGSYTEIDNFVSSGSGASCAQLINTGNTPPTITALAAYNIPISTPFALTASASDANGDTLTYDWEEMDAGTSQGTQNPSATATNALFRSFAPTFSPTRIFPSLTYILNNANVPPATNAAGYATGEILPAIARTMNFRVTVRDNRAGGGGTQWAATTVTSSALAGPFKVTTPNVPGTIAGGSMQTVTWDVSNTNLPPVSCANVKISLSTDGGLTFPIVLASSVPNSGSATVSIPNTANVATEQGRIKVEAVGNIFFDISDADLTVTSTNTPPALNLTGSLTMVRGTPAAASAIVGTASSANAPLSITATDVPQGINLVPSIDNGNVMLSGTADCRVTTTRTTRTYPITLTVTDAVGSTRSAPVNLIVQANATPTLGDYPANNSVSAGNQLALTPAAAPADANGNLSAAPLLVSPAVVPGGGSIAINQTTGVVTVTTNSSSTLGAFTVRVTLADTCGATLLKEFSVSVTAPAINFTSGPPPVVIVGTPYSFNFTASGSPAPTFSLMSGTLPPGLSLAGNGLLSGTASSAGSGTFPNLMVKASNGVAADATQSFTLTAVTRVANYLASYGLSGGNAAPFFDFDLDDIANLLEYALQLDPTSASRAGLPLVSLKDYAGTKYLSMTFTRSSVATDLTYIVQGSSNLVQWDDLASSIAGAPTSGPGFVSESGAAPVFFVEVRDTVALDPDAPPKRFLRLQVTSP